MKKILIILFMMLSLGAQGQTFSTLMRERTRIFNVLDYGAISDDAISDVNAINDAIDSAYNLYSYSFGGGTVYIPAGVYLINDTIHLRSNVSIRMERNTLLYTSSYSGAVFVGDATVTHSYVSGGILFSGENTMTGISIRANASGQYMQECGFHDMTIQGCLTGIQFYSDNVGFINSNYFDNIWIEDFVNGIVAYEGAGSTGLSGNNFNNIVLQCDDATLYGLKNIDLSYSTFTGLFIWDLPVTATAGIRLRNGSGNVFIGGYWEETGFSDTGLRNKFINGQRIKVYQRAYSLTDGAPSDAQIDAATGLTPATAGAGYEITLMDTDGTLGIYLIRTNGYYWYYVELSRAL